MRNDLKDAWNIRVLRPDKLQLVDTAKDLGSTPDTNDHNNIMLNHDNLNKKWVGLWQFSFGNQFW